MKSKKTLLMLCTDLPYPITEGTRLDIWGRLLFFHREGWEVELAICPTPKKMEGIKEEKPTSWPIPFEKNFIPRRNRWSFLERPQTITKLQALVDRLKPSVIWCEYSEFATLAAKLNLENAKIWFRSHNFELAHDWDHGVGYGLRNPPNKIPSLSYSVRWILGILKRMLIAPFIFAAEWQMHHIADRIFFISHGDKLTMTRLYGGTCRKDWILPFLDTSRVPVKTGKSLLDVFYLGSDYQYSIHRAGACKLLFEIIPEVEKAMPNCFRFHFIGKGSKREFGRYQAAHILIHDFVENLPELLNEMDIACFPVEIGWGCKIKMIESLASGLPILGSEATFRGVPPAPGAYEVCRSVKDYVEAFRKLRNADARRMMGEKGMKQYEIWRSQAEQTLREALKEVLSQ